jgi:DNA-binding NtrC family response regulator
MPCPIILVVEEDDHVRLTLAAILTQAGYHVITAGKACEVLDKLAAHSFDLVLLDVEMPGMQGLAGLSLLHQVYPKLPAVVLTISSDIDFPRETQALAQWQCFLKPADPALLLEGVKKILSELSLKS